MRALADLRLQNQRLVGPGFASPVEVVRWLGAVQSQDFHGAKWGVALRTRRADEPALDRAFDAGEIVRVHAMRPTWHFVASDDVRWLLALTSPRVHAANAPRYRRLELDDALFRRARPLLTGALRGARHQTRQELGDALEAGGIAEPRGQRLAYLIMHAELEGLLCSGPRRGKQQTYALLEERVAPQPVLPRDEALATLAERYFASHGPATAHDFAWWSGLTVADARKALELLGSAVERFDTEGRAYWATAPVSAAQLEGPVVHLLPNYDEHVVAYRDHGPTMHPDTQEVLSGWSRSPLDSHLLSLDGLIVGRWRRTVAKQSAVVRIEALVPLSEAAHGALRSAAERYGRFLRTQVEVLMAGRTDPGAPAAPGSPPSWPEPESP